jgi:nucleoid DNA-binding protein
VFDEVSRSLKKGDKVVLSSFGTFYVGKVKDKHVEPFGEKTKRQVVKGHRVVNFRVGKPLKRMVW